MVIIPYEPPFQSRLYNDRIIDTGESLLLLFENSEQIYNYEIRTGKIKIYKPQTENYMFGGGPVIKNKNELLMFPYESSDILAYDYCTGSIESRKFWGKEIKAAKCYEVIDSKLYVVDSGSNTLYCYDFSDVSSTEMHIGAEENQYWGVKRAGKYFVLPHMEKRAITLWNEESGESIELTGFPERYASWEKYAYFDIFERNGKIYIFPFYGNMILEVDVENKVIHSIFDDVFFYSDYDVNSEDCSVNTYSYVGKYNEFVYAYSLKKNCWQIFNLDTMDMQEIYWPEIKEERHKALVECILDNKIRKKSFYEFEKTSICTLENYIKGLACNNEERRFTEHIENDVGIRIHKFIASSL